MQPRRAENSAGSAALLASTFLVIVLFNALFLMTKIGRVDFFWGFASVLFVVIPLVFHIDRGYLPSLTADVSDDAWKKLVFGTLTAGLLFSIFYAGNRLALSILPFAESGIGDVYRLKTGSSLWKIVPLIVLVIGPGEELLWRGFIQKQYTQRYGGVSGLAISAVLYAIAHAGSANAMLVLSAFVAGVFWGWTFKWRKSLLLNICSHVVWDLAVFIAFPFAR